MKNWTIEQLARYWYQNTTDEARDHGHWVVILATDGEHKGKFLEMENRLEKEPYFTFQVMNCKTAAITFEKYQKCIIQKSYQHFLMKYYYKEDLSKVDFNSKFYDEKPSTSEMAKKVVVVVTGVRILLALSGTIDIVTDVQYAADSAYFEHEDLGEDGPLLQRICWAIIIASFLCLLFLVYASSKL